MEKQTPHYDLAVVKERVVRDGIFTFTATARKGAAALGLSEAEAVSNGRTAYVKLTLQDGALVIQFKEK